MEVLHYFGAALGLGLIVVGADWELVGCSSGSRWDRSSTRSNR
ncbi:MAG: hypothetical protein CM1200mP10_01210 [Candidatus Neomarinimicrobiota bacterium]|nr:MAG: hypothetical protein CM1200mP10_01210 [Candidatus Neomarinimicrobiota bacterium]